VGLVTAKFAVLLVELYVIAPGITTLDGLVTVKVVELMVDASIGSLKVADTLELRHTPVALFIGLFPVTVGDVMSGPAPVVKDQT
jgi:hypothetical protein